MCAPLVLILLLGYVDAEICDIFGKKSEVFAMSIDQEAAKAIATKGEKIYLETIKPHIDLGQERGKFIVIDVDTGDYEIDKRDAAATKRLHERRPSAVTYAVRVGRPAAYRMIGGKINRRAS